MQNMITRFWNTAPKTVPLLIPQAVVGSASIAMMSDWLFAKGVEILLCCGSCGVLADIPLSRSGHCGMRVLPANICRRNGILIYIKNPCRYSGRCLKNMTSHTGNAPHNPQMPFTAKRKKWSATASDRAARLLKWSAPLWPPLPRSATKYSANFCTAGIF